MRRPPQHSVITFLPGDDDPLARQRGVEALVRGLKDATGQGKNARAVLVKRVDGVDPADSVLGDPLRAGGFVATSRGFHLRSPRDRDDAHALN